MSIVADPEQKLVAATVGEKAGTIALTRNVSTLMVQEVRLVSVTQ
jgi:hypothetical protein